MNFRTEKWPSSEAGIFLKNQLRSAHRTYGYRVDPGGTAPGGSLGAKSALVLYKLPFRTAQIRLQLPFLCRTAH